MENLTQIADRWDGIEQENNIFEISPKQRVQELIANLGFTGTVNEGAHSLWLPRPFHYTSIDNSINIGSSHTVVHKNDKKKEKKEEERASLAVIIGVAAVALFEFAIFWVAGSRYMSDRALYNDLEQNKQNVESAGTPDAVNQFVVKGYKKKINFEVENCQRFVAIRLKQDKWFLACGAVGTALMLSLAADQLWKRNIWFYRTWSTAIVVQPMLGFATYMSGPSGQQAKKLNTALNTAHEYRREEMEAYSEGMGAYVTRHSYLSNFARHDASLGRNSGPSAPSEFDLK
jgi:hypothetical protein